MTGVPTLENSEHITTWMGRDIRELTREELIAALEQTTRAYHAHLQGSIRSVRLMADLHRMNNG